MSRERLEDHRRLWRRKPALRGVYAPWFEALAAALPRGGRALEVGAGPGFFAEAARAARPATRLVSSDLIPAAWNDLAADAARLPFVARAFDAVVGLDVVHHLARPEAFFREAARVLRPGGRLAVVEPWVTPLSYPVYRFLHREGLRSGLDPWRPFGGDAKPAFEGDGGLFTRLVRGTSAARWRELGFEAPCLRLFNGFAYLLSLGFRERSLLPARLQPLVSRIDRATQPLAGWLALRACATWPRAVDAATGGGRE